MAMHHEKQGQFATDHLLSFSLYLLFISSSVFDSFIQLHRSFWSFFCGYSFSSEYMAAEKHKGHFCLLRGASAFCALHRSYSKDRHISCECSWGDCASGFLLFEGVLLLPLLIWFMRITFVSGMYILCALYASSRPWLRKQQTIHFTFSNISNNNNSDDIIA